MPDIFSKELDNGQYGIEALSELTQLANRVYDLADKVYFDDRKIDLSDLGDIAFIGPDIVNRAQSFAGKASLLDEEVTDLSEAEKATLRTLAGERVENPSYRKIHAGLLDVIDGIAELGNEQNPVD